MNIKALIEEKRTLITAMNDIASKMETEKRSMSDEERATFEANKKRVEEINEAIEADSEVRALYTPDKKDESKAPTERELERRSFEMFIRNNMSEEARANLTKSTNGYEIPASISEEIISAAREMSPLLAKCNFVQTKGDLIFPVYGEDTDNKINVAYSNEFAALTANSGKITTIDIRGFLVGALVKVSRSLIDNVDIDVVAFVIKEMGKAFAFFMEREAINGTSGKTTGIIPAAKNIVNVAADKLTADDLIDLQTAVNSIFQKNAYWTVNPKTLAVIRKFKDNENRYLLTQSLDEGFPWMLLGKPVYISDNMPEIGTGNVSVIYGDMAGVIVKTTKGVEIQVLNEKFADEHAVGIVGWAELDANVTNNDMIAVIKHQ